MSSKHESNLLDLGSSSQTLTFLFIDIEDSARLLDDVGPSNYERLTAEYRKVVGDSLARFHETEIEIAGEEFFATFYSTNCALTAAREIQLRLKRNPEFAHLRVRMGIHCGTAIHSGDDYVGIDINRAARILAVAHGGQIVVSETAVQIIESEEQANFEFLDLGRHRLKDLSEPQHLFQLQAEGLQNEFPPLLTLEAFPTNLPVQLTPFLGRRREIEALAQLITSGQTPLITLTGPGGVGKTRLALQSAAAIVEQFSDGVFFVGFASVQSHDLILATIAQMFGLRGSDSDSLLDAIATFLARKNILLVLDNLEHLPLAGSVLAKLLDKSPNLKVLVTSRTRLEIPGEIEFAVDSLPVPDPDHIHSIATLRTNESVALFTDRAKAVAPLFEVTEQNAKAVASICQRLDGLPLAIELAAAKIKLFSPAALLQRLSKRLPVLSTRLTDLPARQKTIRATIEWSFALLSENDRILLARLSVFSGGCTLEAALAVCDPNRDLGARAGIRSLVRNNLLQPRQVADDTRFYLLELIREFAQEVLDERREAQAVAQAHTKFFLDLIERDEPKARSRDGKRWSARIDADFANFRTALESALEAADDQTVVRLIGALWRPWFFGWKTATVKDLLNRIDPLLRDSSNLDPHLLVDAYVGVSALAIWGGDRTRGELFASQLLELAERHNLTRGKAYALWLLGTSASFTENDTKANSLLTTTLAIARKTSDPFVQAWALVNLGSNYMGQGENTRAIELFNEAMQISEKTGDINIAAGSARNIGMAAMGLGDRNRAIRSFSQALQFSQLMQSSYMAITTLSCSAASLALVDPVVSAKLCGKTDALYEEMALSRHWLEVRMREKTIEDLHTKLSEEEITSTSEAGKALTVDEAVTLAIRTANEVHQVT